MSYPPAVQAVLDRAGVRTLEEWNAAMSQGTAGGVNAVQRAMGHTNPGELTWTRVDDASDLAEKMNRERDEAAAVQVELERRRAGEWAAYQAALLPDLTVPSVWNPTPTNYNPDPLGRTDLERQRAEIAAADAVGSIPFDVLPPILQQLEERRTGIPIRSIDDMGGSASFAVEPAVVESVQQPEEAMSLLGSIASGVGNFISGGAKALLESRRDTPVQGNYAVQQWQDPKSVPGMPSYQEASIFPYGQVGQLIGKGTALLGTAAAAYQAGQAVLQSGNRSVVMGGVKPQSVNRKTLVCPSKYVLGADGNCYPKSMIPRSARKWTPDPKPVVSRSDQKAITRAASAKKRLVKLTNAAGAHATITRPHKHTTSSRKK